MTTDPSGRSGRSPFGGIARVVTLIVVVAACGGSGGTTTTVPGSTAATTTTVSDGGSSTTSASDDAAVLALRAAIDAVGPSYVFTTRVLIGETPISEVAGQIDGDTRYYVVTAEGATLEYLVTADGRWVREPEGAWLQLNQPAPVRAPLAALASPKSARIVSVVDDEAVIEATYDGEVVGFEGVDVTVTLTVRGGLLEVIEYDAQIGQSLARVTTVIDADALIQPIDQPPA